ncbi:hypothetical protein IAT38_002814 [Cryptococcus sp. DSM 104549]
MPPQTTSLSDGWQFSQIPSPSWPRIKPDWVPCKSSVPTSVHVELVLAGRIKDPFKELNEWEAQWVGEADWGFRKVFGVDQVVLKEAKVDLVFDGLDTHCSITLNGHHLANTNNMFLSHRVGCKPYLEEGENELLLEFKSSWHESKKEEAAHGGPREVWNGDPCRVYTRKAQYGWGWDWGPKLMTVGPWRPITLEAYTNRINDVRVDTDLLSPGYTTATLQATVDVFPRPSDKDLKLRFVLRGPHSTVVREAEQAVDDSCLEWKFEEGEVKAWWPVGYGNQPLYELETSLIKLDGSIAATALTRVAFRHARVVQEPLADQPGTSFLFEINGVRIFCGGSNWIPADSFLTEITPERYRQWVQLLAEGNQNMLRVWGGGVYEHEALYNACDELGVLVWQDFMFGCGIYPSYPALNDSIEKEAEQAVKRLRNHPSVVIFAGNNEDYQVAESLKVVDYEDESGDYMHSKFPGRHIYEVILPKVVHHLSNIYYHRGSPYGGKNTRDPTVGDIHQWNVWHGTQEPWANWYKLAGRFVSEFGMQGYPDMRTVRTWSDDEKELFPQSRVSVQHNKAAGFERRLELYLMENFRHTFDMESYVYYTQIMQAECLSAAYRLWRREWKGKGREYTAGALVWQLNDCWPCTSWSIADYYLRPTPAYFAIARELAQYTVGITRKEIKKPLNETTDAFFNIKQELQVWGCNSTLCPTHDITLELTSFELGKHQLHHCTIPVILYPNSSTQLFTGLVPGQPTRVTEADSPLPIVVQARLVDEHGHVLARHSNWPEPYKFLRFPTAEQVGLEVVVDGDEVTLRGKQPVKGVVLDVKDGKEVRWNDQAIDLMPGDEQVVEGKGLAGREVVVTYLGQDSQ